MATSAYSPAPYPEYTRPGLPGGSKRRRSPAQKSPYRVWNSLKDGSG